MDLHNHFAQDTLDTVGLDPRSPSAEIEKAAEIQKYSYGVNCSMDELVAFLTEWVARERFALTATAHREARALLRMPPGAAVHHLDGNPYNNAPENLRVVDPRENRRSS